MKRISDFIRTQGTGIIFMTGLGTFLAILGPYDTAALGWPWVWLYWTGLMLLGGYSGVAASAVLNRVAPDLPRWASYPLIAVLVLVSVPVTIAVISIQGVFGSFPPVYAWPIIYFFVLVISAGVAALTYLLERHGTASAEPGIGRALTDKLPVRFRTADLIALQSEDHYLRVHTSRGDTLILMRLSDAISAVEALEGAQIHRSWWVARTAIDHAEKSGGRAELTLTNGITAPVSRSYYPDLRERGWI